MKYIKVKFTQEGLHQFIGAPDEVGYLGNLHRHLFHISVKVEVFHNDRELEFLMFMHDIKKYVINKYLKGEYIINSCEMLAENILEYVHKKYGPRCCEVEVSEDDENSAIVTNY